MNEGKTDTVLLGSLDRPWRRTRRGRFEARARALGIPVAGRTKEAISRDVRRAEFIEDLWARAAELGIPQKGETIDGVAAAVDAWHERHSLELDADDLGLDHAGLSLAELRNRVAQQRDRVHLLVDAKELGVDPTGLDNRELERQTQERTEDVAPADQEQLDYIEELCGVLPRPASHLEAEKVIRFLEDHSFSCPRCGDAVHARDGSCAMCSAQFENIRIPIILPPRRFPIGIEPLDELRDRMLERRFQ